MGLVKFILEAPHFKIGEVYAFEASGKRQILGTYNKENVADREIVDEMIKANWPVKIIED